MCGPTSWDLLETHGVPFSDSRRGKKVGEICSGHSSVGHVPQPGVMCPKTSGLEHLFMGGILKIEIQFYKVG